MSSKPIMACDADGVIVDWHTPFHNFVQRYPFAKQCPIDEVLHFSLTEAYGCSIQEIEEVNQNYYKENKLEDNLPIPGSIETILRLKEHFRPVIITSRKDEFKLATKTWFNQYLPGITIFFSQGLANPLAGDIGRKTKEQIAQAIGAICLIEDNPYEFDDWRSETVIPICFEQPWNKGCQVQRMSWPGIENFLMARLQGE